MLKLTKIALLVLCVATSASSFAANQQAASPQCTVTFRGEPPVVATVATDGKSAVARSAYWTDEPLNRVSTTVVGHIKSTSGGKVEFWLEPTSDGRILARWQWQEYRLETFKGDDGVSSIQVPSDFVSVAGNLLADFANEFGIGEDVANARLRIKCRKSLD